MEFCPKCGAPLVEKRKNFGCARCNYSTKEKIKMKTSEVLKERQGVAVVKDKDVDVFPIIPAKCPKCENEEAHFWTAQTRAGDEAETRFFKCTKCQHTWREYR